MSHKLQHQPAGSLPAYVAFRNNLLVPPTLPISPNFPGPSRSAAAGAAWLPLAALTFSLILSTHSKLSWGISFRELLGPAIPSVNPFPLPLSSPSVHELDRDRPVVALPESDVVDVEDDGGSTGTRGLLLPYATGVRGRRGPRRSSAPTPLTARFFLTNSGLVAMALTGLLGGLGRGLTLGLPPPP